VALSESTELIIALFDIVCFIRNETKQTDRVTDRDVEYAGVALTAHDFDSALSQARASYSDSIGAPKVC
jgi:hypothetical protein